MIEYGQEMPQSQTAGLTRHGTVMKGHKEGIIQAVTVQYTYVLSSFSFQGEKNYAQITPWFAWILPQS